MKIAAQMTRKEGGQKMTRKERDKIRELQNRLIEKLEHRGFTEHCMKDEYTLEEQRLTCIKCAHPLQDNQLVKDAYRQNTTVSWAKVQLKILADMARDRDIKWFADQAEKIANGLRCLDT
jgi:predicted Abi (CAAX) family protease